MAGFVQYRTGTDVTRGLERCLPESQVLTDAAQTYIDSASTNNWPSIKAAFGKLIQQFLQEWVTFRTGCDRGT